MDFVIDAEHLRKLLGAAKCDCWWEDSNEIGYGITFSRLLQLINESQRKSQENWKTESDDSIEIALMRLGILKPRDINHANPLGPLHCLKCGSPELYADQTGNGHNTREITIKCANCLEIVAKTTEELK